MKEIIFGTVNPAKIRQVRDVLEPLGFKVTSLADFSQKIVVDEDGETAEANACKKAKIYAQTLGQPVLSTDVGLYFNDLPADQQPGLFVRRIAGKDRASDDEMLAYYTGLAAKMGDKIDAYWHYAFALARPDGSCVSFTHDTPRIFVSKPSGKVVEGYPLESLQIDPESGKYCSDMTDVELAAFWRRTIGGPLMMFVEEHFA